MPNPAVPNTILDAHVFEALFDQSDEGICVLRTVLDARGEPADFEYVKANTAFERITGLSGIGGKRVREVSSGQPDHWAETLADVARTGEPVQMSDYSPRLGRWFEGHVFRVGDRAECVLAVRFRDVTERRTVHERLASIYGITTMGVMFWGKGFCLQDVNEGFLQMTGFTRDEAIGMTWQQLTPLEFHEISQRAVAEVMTRGETTPFEKQYFRKDGSRWWGLFAARKIGDEVVEFVVDVSERREAETALRDANRRKDEFLATLAHELRNPLAPIRTGLQIMRMTRPADEPVMQVIGVMDRQLAHLVRLVDDLLDLARISAGKVRMDRRILSLREVLERSIEATQVQVHSRRHRLDVNLPAAEIHVDGDLDRLAQVFSNLLSNAAKYTPSGGHITLETKVHTTTPPGDVVVSIVDNGVGIPADQQSQVFDLFTQVRDHQSQFEGGLGIGLSLVQSLVRMHGGSVWLESSGPGRGSTFCVKLPLADGAQVQAHEAATSGVQAHHTPIRILIADDNIDAAETLAMLLRREGHEVAIAANGREAVEQTQLFAPDLALLDLGMPLMGGEEAARLIRAAPGGQDVRLVAVTGWGQPSDRDRTQQAGFDLHLVKPVTPEDIESALALVPDR